MYNIEEQIDTFRNSIGRPTHILLTEAQYLRILSNLGINGKNMKNPMKELYGLQVVFTEYPIENPKVLKIGI